MRKLLLVIGILIFLISCSKQKEIKDPITGKLIERYNYYEDKNGSFIKDGKYQAWYSNEQIEKSGNYKDNKKHGLWKYWSKEGLLSAEAEYNEGMKEGLYNKYDENGNLKSESIYNKDTLEGLEKIYFPNGIIKSEINFVNGCKEGIVYVNDSLGNKRIKKEYNLGVKTGTWILWKDKEIVREVEFKNNLPVSLIGLWKDSKKRNVTFEFKENGTVIKKQPMFAYSLGNNDPLTKQNYILDCDIESFRLLYVNSDKVAGLYYIEKMTENKLDLIGIIPNGKYNLVKVK
jgi:antitoxin component YwqK of YwqJK toxin-antitoxin module